PLRSRPSGPGLTAAPTSDPRGPSPSLRRTVALRLLGADLGRGADLERLALGRHLDRAVGAAQLGPLFLRRLVELVEERVRVERIVVEEHEPLSLDPPREGQGVGEPRVAPADVLGVLLIGVLAVVNQEVRVAREVIAADPLGLEGLERGAKAWLVVGDVGER